MAQMSVNILDEQVSVTRGLEFAERHVLKAYFRKQQSNWNQLKQSMSDPEVSKYIIVLLRISIARWFSAKMCLTVIALQLVSHVIQK